MELAKGLDLAGLSASVPPPPSPPGCTTTTRSRPGRRARGRPGAELLIASIDELTPEDRRHVAALVESLRKKASQEQADG